MSKKQITFNANSPKADVEKRAHELAERGKYVSERYKNTGIIIEGDTWFFGMAKQLHTTWMIDPMIYSGKCTRVQLQGEKADADT